MLASCAKSSSKILLVAVTFMYRQKKSDHHKGCIHFLRSFLLLLIQVEQYVSYLLMNGKLPQRGPSMNSMDKYMKSYKSKIMIQNFI